MQPNSDISMDDALFIGDSRTVGLMEYAGIDGADYFCTVGMSVYNIHKKPVSVPNVGKVTLTELLNSKKYGKIYIMLGINEVGYKFSNTIEKYSELIEFVKSKQSDAVIFIQANLHVTKSRSDSDKVVNNTAINGLNAELAKLADGKSKFYLDANILFDDKTGGLSSDKSKDGTHLYAKYYSEWGKWIIRQTASLIGEG
jgi:lysophospholipase L1-like esterase